MSDSNFCPICGKKFGSWGGWDGHRCSPKYLMSRERAIKTNRADRVRQLSERARLEYGFSLLTASGDEDTDD